MAMLEPRLSRRHPASPGGAIDGRTQLGAHGFKRRRFEQTIACASPGRHRQALSWRAGSRLVVRRRPRLQPQDG